MNLYIKVKDGQVVGHPYVEENLKQAYGVDVITAEFLASHDLVEFVRHTAPIGTMQIDDPSYELREDGKVYEVVPTRPLTQEEKIEFWVRRPRNFELAQSDWTQMPDSPLSTAKKAEWAAYRQELRDMTTVYADIQDPAEIVPPTKPE